MAAPTSVCPCLRESPWPSRRGSLLAQAYLYLWSALACCWLACTVAVAQTPQDVAALRPRAEAAFTHKDYSEAATLFAQVAAGSAPGTTVRASMLLMQAKCLVNVNRFHEAETVLEAALKDEPRAAESLYLLGYVLQREDKPAASLQAFTQAAALTTPQPNDLKLVGLDYVLLDDYPDAVHWLTRSVAADPHNAEAWYDLGRAQMHQGHFEEAIKAFHRCLALEPSNVKAMDNLGLSLEAQNKPEDALAVYAAGEHTAQADHHPDPYLLLDYATLLDNRSAYAQAEPLLQQAASLAATEPHVWEEMGRCALGAKRLDAARDALQRASSLDPANAGVHFQLARVYRTLGQQALSAAEFKRSAELYAKPHNDPSPSR